MAAIQSSVLIFSLHLINNRIMNILLFHPSQRISSNIKNDELVVVNNTQKLSHIREILKLNVGATLQVGELGGKIGEGEILELTETEMTLKLNLQRHPPEKLPCTIILALPRPQQLKRILLHLSSLGVKEIHLLQTQRVEKNYWQSPTLNNIENYLIEGLEQSVDTILPKVFLHRNYRKFVENDFKAICEGKTIWLAHPGNYPQSSMGNSDEQVLLVGPEGGFINDEVQDFIQQGAKVVSLGKRILKVETALPVLIAKIFNFQ